MKIGLISDIHANLPALESVFKSGKAQNIDRWLCMGDIVSYYYWPSECIELLIQNSVECINGNHDRALISPSKLSFSKDYIKKYGSGASLALNVLSIKQLDWLNSLPQTLELIIDGYSVLMCHGSPWDGDYYIYPDAKAEVFNRVKETGYDIVFYGHTHYPIIWQDSSIIIANPGSVGQPRDSIPGACWAIWDTRENKIKMMRESYNSDDVIQACKKYDSENTYLQEALIRTKSI